MTTQKGRIKTLGVTHFRRQLPLSQDCLSFLESVVECEFFETVPSFEQLLVISYHRHVTMAKVLLVPLHVTLCPSFSAVFAWGSSTYRGPWQIWVGSSRVRHCGWEWDENIEERWRKAVSSCMFWIRCMNEGGQFCDAQKHGMESKSPNIEPPCPNLGAELPMMLFKSPRADNNFGTKCSILTSQERWERITGWRLLVQPQAKWAWPRVTDCLISGAVIARKLENYPPGASQLRFRPLGLLPFRQSKMTFI